jgi:hypothetical protein
MVGNSDSRSWYAHACDYVDMKWPNAAPNSRRGIAEALATVTPAFPPNGAGGRQPTTEAIRDALYGWAFNAARRAGGGPPDGLAQVLAWIERTTLTLAEIADPVITRRALDTLARKLDGSPAAATTVSRKRAVLYNALEYAIERGDLDTNPLDHIRWTAPKALETVDFRVVINHDQARALLAAVEAQGETGRRLKAFREAKQSVVHHDLPMVDPLGERISLQLHIDG